jgi:hypothetical protein
MGRHLLDRSKFGANLNPFEIHLIRFESESGGTVLPGPRVNAAPCRACPAPSRCPPGPAVARSRLSATHVRACQPLTSAPAAQAAFHHARAPLSPPLCPTRRPTPQHPSAGSRHPPPPLKRVLSPTVARKNFLPRRAFRPAPTPRLQSPPTPPPLAAGPPPRTLPPRRSHPPPKRHHVGRFPPPHRCPTSSVSPASALLARRICRVMVVL